MAYTPSQTGAAFPNTIAGLTPPVFGAVGGSIANQSVVSTMYDYHPLQLMRTVFERHSNFPTFRMMLKAFGMGKPAKAPVVGHYEWDWMDNLLKCGTVTNSATPGASITFALHTDMMYNAGATVSGSARQASSPRVGQVIYFKNYKTAIITAKDTSVTPHTITIKPTDPTLALTNATIVTGGEYFLSTNAWGEGTNLPDGVTPRILKYTNGFQIIKEAGGATGTELTNELYIQPVQNQDGSIYLKIKEDLARRFELSCGNALLFGQPISGVTVLNTQLGHDVPVNGTQGLIDFGLSYGYTDAYTAGSYALADLDGLAAKYEQERVPERRILTLDGFSIFQETENLLMTLLDGDLSVAVMRDFAFSDAGVPTDLMQIASDPQWNFYIGFKSVHKSGYFFHFRQMHEFSSIRGAGASGYDFPNWRICTPLGFTTNKNDGSKSGYIGYHYKELNGYSREAVVGEFAGAGAAHFRAFAQMPTNEWDITRSFILGEIAGHFACPNHIIIQKTV